MSEEKRPLGVTDAQIKKWKDDHGSIMLLSCGEQPFYAYVRKPSWTDIQMAESVAKGDKYKAIQWLYHQIKLKADDELFEKDDEIKASVSLEVNMLFQIKKVEVKEL